MEMNYLFRENGFLFEYLTMFWLTGQSWTRILNSWVSLRN